jgi:hypothetical protein
MSYLRRYGLAAYWALFAAYTMYMAQWPGLMLHPERWTYPWKSALAVCALLAVCVAILYVILRPMSYRHSWWRLLGALVYSGVLVALGISTVATDLPGHAYVPALFSVATLALVVVLALAQGMLILWARWSGHAA